MPGRHWGADYRFGFNGKENDNEAKGEGNQQDYGFRIYDPRLGKFLSTDPLFKTFPWNSTYSYAENDVIRCIDLEGKEKWINNQSDLVYGPLSEDYVNSQKLKPLSQVITDDKLITAIETAQKSPTFVANQKLADLYNFTTIKSKGPGTYTRPKRAPDGTVVGATINVQESIKDQRGVGIRVAFEMVNAKNYKNGNFMELYAKASNGEISKELFVKGIIQLEQEAKINDQLVRYELGDKSISLETYNNLKTNYDEILSKMVQEDYKNGTRETQQGSKKATDVYGDQYDKLTK